MVKPVATLLLAAIMQTALPGGLLKPVPIDAAPWRGLVRVQTELGDRCTGFLVAPSVAITAAHCLFLPAVGRFIQPGSVHVLLRYRMGRFAAHARVRRFIVPRLYDPRSERASAGSDRAVLLLDHAIGASDDSLRLSASLPAVGTRVRLGGYGQGREEIAVAGPTCRITGEQADATGQIVIADDCAVVRGISGAPLLVHDADGAWRVIGVQIEGVVGMPGGFAASLAATGSDSSSDR